MDRNYKINDFLEYMDNKYPENETNTIFLKSEKINKFFISVIRNCIEYSNLLDEDKLLVRQFYNTMVDEFWTNFQKQKEDSLYPKVPKYSAEQAFNVIRSMNCSLEDKLKVAELFEYMER